MPLSSPSLQFSRPDGSESLARFALLPLADQMTALGLTPSLTSLFPESGSGPHPDWSVDDPLTLCQNLLSIVSGMNHPPTTASSEGGQLHFQEVLYTKEEAILMLAHGPVEHFTRDGLSFLRGFLSERRQEEGQEQKEDVSPEEQRRRETIRAVLPALQSLILLLEDARNRGFSHLEVFPEGERDS